ncbi:hypothetical protein AD929_05190 [Gluconobacter potus]|uniref:Uncharacterized protein n=1 Tax=Gluconobacter potus TaxID=2724927 RepID=A0A149QWL5_9PROT|nr:hypothetical protein AD929_05190 [Gluconobacter potus]
MFDRATGAAMRTGEGVSQYGGKLGTVVSSIRDGLGFECIDIKIVYARTDTRINTVQPSKQIPATDMGQEFMASKANVMRVAPSSQCAEKSMMHLPGVGFKQICATGCCLWGRAINCV